MNSNAETKVMGYYTLDGMRVPPRSEASTSSATAMGKDAFKGCPGYNDSGKGGNRRMKNSPRFCFVSKKGL